MRDVKFVEFETCKDPAGYPEGTKFLFNPHHVVVQGFSYRNGGEDVHSVTIHIGDKRWPVKGTLDEVRAKLEGEAEKPKPIITSCDNCDHYSDDELNSYICHHHLWRINHPESEICQEWEPIEGG